MEGMLALFALFSLFWFLGWVVGLFWVVTDATENSSQSAALWGLVVFFGGMLGVVLYALLGRDQKGQSVRDDGSYMASNDGHQASNANARTSLDDSENPSHVCQNCGEQYYLREAAKVDTCQRCGGIHVEQT